MNVRAITAAKTIKNADSNASFSSVIAATEPYRFSDNAGLRSIFRVEQVLCLQVCHAKIGPT